MEYGLIGDPLGHSFSPRVHAALGDYAYALHPLPPEALDAFLRAGAFRGLNVTIPYKKAVLPYCAALSDAARETGAVNTLLKRADGTLYGDNTDVFGLQALLRHAQIDPAGKKALVLGNGGTAATARAALKAAGAREILTVSRRGPLTYAMLGKQRDAELICNATPVGMYPHNGESLLNLSEFPGLRGVVDAVYNPLRTKLVLDARARGVPAQGGLYMLVAQAKASAERFTGRPIPDARIGEIASTLAREVANVVLVGMPGCGKTTVGALLARALGRPFVDTDAMLEARLGEPAGAYLSRVGEARFREAERAAVAEAGKGTGLVIATGGGAVLCPENYAALKQNGMVFFLKRALSSLAQTGRPLSQACAPEALYARRLPSYLAFADHCVDNDGAPEAAAQAIQTLFTEDFRL